MATQLALRPARSTAYGLTPRTGPDPVLASNKAFRAADGIDLPGLRSDPAPRCAGYPDPEVFFPAGADDAPALAEALAVCDGGPLRTRCPAAGVALRADGVWGGQLLARGAPATLTAPGRPPSPRAA